MKLNYISVSNHLLGSFRYQIITPAIVLQKLGHEVLITSEPMPGFDVYLFHKHFNEQDIDFIQNVKKQENKPKTVYIISDSHLTTRNRDHQLKMIEHADIVVVITRKLAEYVKADTGRDAVVIYDPWGIEFQEQIPLYNPGERIKALWFGHKSNLPALLKKLKVLRDIDVSIIVGPDIGGLTVDGEDWPIIQYNIPAMIQGFHNCDVVIIPQDMKNPAKLAKTHNRIVDSFRAGRFVIASPVDAYLDFKEWAYIGDIREGLDWLKEQPREEIERRIGEAQEFIRKTFNPERIGRQWEQALLNG